MDISVPSDIRRRHFLPPIAVGVFVCLTYSSSVMVGNADGLWGVDGGTYHRHLNELLEAGDSALFSLPPRPPLAPGVLLLPFQWAMGADVGLRAFAATGAAVAFAGALHLYRAFLSRTHAAVAAALFAFNPFVATAVVDAPLLPMALGILAIGLRAPLDWSQGDETPRRAGWSCAALALLPYVNQTSAGLCVIMLAAMLPAAAVLRRRADLNIIAGTFPKAATLALPFALPAGLWYVGVAPGALRYTGSALLTSADVGILLLAAIGYLGAAFAMAMMRLPPAARLMQIALAVCGALLLFDSGDESIANLPYRASYLAPLFLSPLALWWKAKMRWGNKYILVIGFMASMLLCSHILHQQARYSDIVNGDMRRALEFVQRNMREGEIALASNYALANWAAGVFDIPVDATWRLTTDGVGPPPRYAEMQLRSHCALGWRTDCEAAPPYRYIIIDLEKPREIDEGLGYPHYVPMWRSVMERPDISVAFASGEAIVLEPRR